MTYELLIAEKPNAAEKIAQALADDEPEKRNVSGKINFYEFTHKGKKIRITSAVGHLFSLAEKNKKGWTYPVFDVEWKPIYEVNKKAVFSKPYADAIKKLTKEADSYTICTDYDAEGEVIGYNVLRFICHQKDASRMKFSTLTKDELVESYETRSNTINWGAAKAGETRHILDWYYGINLSRALTLSVSLKKGKSGKGGFNLLSSGRVQAPALKILADREKEINAFKPEPYWQLFLVTPDFEATHKEDKIFDQKQAQKIYDKIKDEKKASVKSVDKSIVEQPAPNPFDLTTLQTESYAAFGFSPKRTLEIAQELYTAGFISYPRTSSNQLSDKLGFKKILQQLSKLEKFSGVGELVGIILSLKSLIPNNGKKSDPAHPAIYPTGIIPKRMKDDEAKVYELIVRRFLATFASKEIKESLKVILDVKGEEFIAKGMTTKDEGWKKFYYYSKKDDVELPEMKKGQEIKINSINKEQKETKPPKRYTEASIVRELEKLNLGTKATRAAIVDTLFNRNYIKGKKIELTELGMQVTSTLEKYVPEIVDEALTRKFEEEMEKIEQGKETPEHVLEEAREELTKMLAKFKSKEENIGEEIKDSIQATRIELEHVGLCPVCHKGVLTIRKGKFGPFLACNAYPDCKTIYSLPQGKIEPAKKNCETCSQPMIRVIRAKRQPQELCVNYDCSSKPGISDEAAKMLGKPCPKDGEGSEKSAGSILVERKSFFGKFVACSNYPKCRYTIKQFESAAEKKIKAADDLFKKKVDKKEDDVED